MIPKITSTTSNGDKIFNIEWKSYPISASVYNSIVSDFKKNVVFDVKFISGDIKQNQRASILSSLIKQYTINNYSRVTSKINEIAALYNKNKDIRALVDIYKYSPLKMMIFILIHNGINERHIESIISNINEYTTYTSHPYAYEFIDQVDYDNIVYSINNDINNQYVAQYNTKLSQIYEDSFVSWLKSAGISLYDETYMRAQKYTYTPDVLFVDHVNINGKRIHWIDFKSYVGTKIPLLYKSNKAQATKYAAEYGDGAICYQLSYIEDLKFADTLLLDGSFIPYEKYIIDNIHESPQIKVTQTSQTKVSQ